MQPWRITCSWLPSQVATLTDITVTRRSVKGLRSLMMWWMVIWQV